MLTCQIIFKKKKGIKMTYTILSRPPVSIPLRDCLTIRHLTVLTVNADGRAIRVRADTPRHGHRAFAVMRRDRLGRLLQARPVLQGVRLDGHTNLNLTLVVDVPVRVADHVGKVELLRLGECVRRVRVQQCGTRWR